jgi:hypothetical protein
MVAQWPYNGVTVLLSVVTVAQQLCYSVVRALLIVEVVERKHGRLSKEIVSIEFHKNSNPESTKQTANSKVQAAGRRQEAADSRQEAADGSGNSSKTQGGTLTSSKNVAGISCFSAASSIPGTILQICQNVFYEHEFVY